MGALLLHPIGSEADPGAHNPEAHDRADFAPALPPFFFENSGSAAGDDNRSSVDGCSSGGSGR